MHAAFLSCSFRNTSSVHPALRDFLHPTYYQIHEMITAASRRCGTCASAGASADANADANADASAGASADAVTER